MATGGCEQTSDEIFNFKCTPCAALNKAREAVKYCVQCQGYCCQSCVDMHKVVPALKGHNLKDKSNLKSTVLTTELPAVPTETCAVHEIKILDMYCGNHDIVGCTSCIALDHRNCIDVHLVPDVIDTMFKKADAEQAFQKVQERKTELEKVKSWRETLIDELKKSKTKAVNEIQEFRKELENLLIELEKKSIKEVTTQFQRIELALQRDIEEAVSHIAIMKKAADDLLKSEGNMAQQFVSMKKAKREISQSEKIGSPSPSAVEPAISFSPNENIKRFIQQQESLGSVCHNDHAPLESRTNLYTVQSSRELNIRLQNDSSECYVFGSCLTQDGMLLLADYHNRKLKRVDIGQMKVTDHCDLPSKPRSVSETNRNEAAVSLADNDTIQFVSLGSIMTPTRQLNLNHPCFGITYKTDRLYITGNNTSLYIHDMSGRLLETVSTDSSGREIFGNSRHVAFSDSGDKMFVTGWGTGLITLDGQGRYISSFKDTELGLASCVCADARGNIFVCGYSSKTVLQLSQGGKKIGEVVKSSDGFGNKQQSMCFDSKHCKLIVAGDNVNMFDLV